VISVSFRETFDADTPPRCRWTSDGDKRQYKIPGWKSMEQSRTVIMKKLAELFKFPGIGAFKYCILIGCQL
jgi:hypothetical protein